MTYRYLFILLFCAKLSTRVHLWNKYLSGIPIIVHPRGLNSQALRIYYFVVLYGRYPIWKAVLLALLGVGQIFAILPISWQPDMAESDFCPVETTRVVWCVEFYFGFCSFLNIKRKRKIIVTIIHSSHMS